MGRCVFVQIEAQHLRRFVTLSVQLAIQSGIRSGIQDLIFSKSWVSLIAPDVRMLSSDTGPNMNVNGSFGDWLKQRRKALDLTQADLADQVGCSTMTIRKIEADERRPSKQISERMADVLAISDEERAAFVAFARRVADTQPLLLDDLTPLTPTSNLPPQATPFIGRENELAQIGDRLADPGCRLLTLVGPGGIGKTRLALQAAADRVGEFADGVYFVSLTPVGSTTFIASAIASALQISFYGQEEPDVQVVNYLRGKHLLLVMDNYEHLLPGISLLTDMLANAPRLKILATSRERLNLQEEWVLPVEGLPFPAQETDAEVGSYSAVQLFVQTARRLQPDFSLHGNQDGVSDICRAVEGMPLGIELATTWLRAMPCHKIAGEIRRDLDFLASPLRNVEERHRNLRAVFEHSWSLLSEVERGVLMKLSVFRGGFDAEAAEQIAGASLLVLAGLVDKSLLRLNASERYEMHELLRQFAADKLMESNETAEIEQSHFQFFLSLAEQLEQGLFGSQHLVSLDRLEIEHDNFRASLNWASRVGDAESGLRLAGALGWFWNCRVYHIEGRAWLEKFLAAGSNAPVPVRAKALEHILGLSDLLRDDARVAALCEEGLTLAREVEDQWLKAWLLSRLGSLQASVDGLSGERRRAYLEEALALFRQLEDNWGICHTLGRLAREWLWRGDFASAGEPLEEGIRLARQVQDKSNLNWLLMLSGRIYWYQGITDYRTERIFQEMLALSHELGYKHLIVVALCELGKIAHLRGEDERARVLFEKCLMLSREIDANWYEFDYLIWLADNFCAHGEPDRGARLLGAVSDRVQALHAGPSLPDKVDRSNYERIKAEAHAQLGEAAFAAAFAEGQRMTFDRAVAYARADETYLATEDNVHEP